jgi:catechol 2,3-dioxygenase-like lactoylglutathione lyase family enzyme
LKPYVSLITLGVDDLERSLRFYRRLMAGSIAVKDGKA